MERSTQLTADRQGDGPRVVLVHGFTQTRRSWEPIAGRLAAHHEVVSVDAPGHGRSAAVEADLWQGAELLGEVGGAASYVGYSMGGRLCLHLALARPRLVHTLVLIGATGGIDDPAERQARRETDELLARRLEADGLEPFLARWFAQPLFADLPPEAAGLEARRENTVPGLASSLRLAGTGSQDPLWDRLSELTMPVLVIAGERDDKFRLLGQRLVATIGPNASIAVVPSAGHAAHLAAPDAFLDLVEPFLAR